MTGKTEIGKQWQIMIVVSAQSINVGSRWLAIASSPTQYSCSRSYSAEPYSLWTRADSSALNRRGIANAEFSCDSRQGLAEICTLYMLGIISSLRALLLCYGNRAVTFTKIKGLITISSNYFIFKPSYEIWSNKMNEMTKNKNNHCMTKRYNWVTECDLLSLWIAKRAGRFNSNF